MTGSQGSGSQGSGSQRSGSQGVASQGASSPTARFLGEDAARGGPFALLGIEPGEQRDEAILAARDRRMRQIDAHPQAETPEADEVRLSLYAAAAQLLNPTIRSQLARYWGESGKGAPASSPRVDRPPLRPGSPEQLLEHDAILALAMFGGWNPRSLRRIASIAHARGLGSEEVARTLRRLGHKRRPRAAGAPVLRQASPRPPEPAPVSLLEPTPDQIDPAQQLLKMALLLGGVAVLTLCLISGGVYLLLSGGSSGEPGGESSAELLRPTDHGLGTRDRPTGAGAVRTARTLPSAESLGDPELVVHEINAARLGLEFTPYESTRRFTEATALLANSWARYSPAQLQRANEAVEAFIESTPNPDVLRLAIDAVGGGVVSLGVPGESPSEGQVWGAVWSGAMLAEISDSPALGAVQRAQVDRLRRPATPGASHTRGFRPGALATARTLAQRLGEGGSREAWRRWVEVVDAIATGDELLRTELLTEAIETLMRAPGEAREPVIRDLALAMSWRRRGGARRWLTLTLKRPGADTRALSLLLNALVQESGAPGLDATMTLSPNATARERERLAERLTKAWGLDTDARVGAFTQELLSIYTGAERLRTAPGDPVSRFEGAVRLAYANAGALLARAERFDEAARALDAAGSFRAPRPSYSGSDPFHAIDDGRWTLLIRDAGDDVQQRLDALDRMRDQLTPTIGPSDAETLLHLAIRGSPKSVRDRARLVVARYGASPAMINAALERADDLPANKETRELLEIITARPIPYDSDTAAWRLHARRALLETLIERVAGGGVGEVISAYEHELAAAYSMALGEPASEDESWEPLPLLDAARALAAGLERESQRLGGPDPTRRAPLAEASPTTSMQLFLREQLSICVSIGRLVAIDAPGASGEVARVLDELSNELDTATHVLDQIGACESAIARLWLLREGVTP